MKTLSFNEKWFCNNQEVTLPHDAQIVEKRNKDISTGGHGYFPGGFYEYKKTFTALEEWKNKDVIVEFEGVYKNATIILNNKKIDYHAYGYTGFFVKLEELNYGKENTITVLVDNSKLPNSRWYTGSGIYRPVWLHICERNGIKPEAIKINTISINPPTIRIESPIYIKVDIDGILGEGLNFDMTLPNAKLWSAEHPNLYTAKISAGENDATEISFGIRQIKWSNKGLFINEEKTLLRGGCVHHDNGILGAATYKESEERRIRILKENGFNAIRSSHNPTSKALLEACDRLGMYVMDETFDMWYNRKNSHDYGLDFEKCHEKDTISMINRDYNHPSVILYSIGNEVSEPAEQKGIDIAKKMVEICHNLDSSRPVTCGVNLMIIKRSAKGNGIYQDGEQKTNTKNNDSEEKVKNASLMFNIIASFVGTSMNNGGNSKKVDKLVNPFLNLLDISGYNYGSGRYPIEGKRNPGRLIFGSETFPQDIYKNWEMVKKYPYIIGDFMWTAWDYLGEAGIGAWSYTGGLPFNRPYPWLLAGAGVIDILGNPDGSAKYASTVWGLEKNPVIAVRPINHPGIRVSKSVWRGTNAILSWSWDKCEGNKAYIEIYSNQDTVELLINNKSLGKKKIKQCKVVYKTKYISGTLTAIAFNEKGIEVSRSFLSSAIAPFVIKSHPEKNKVKPGEIIYIPVNIEGQNGIVESNADTRLSVKVKGGELLAFGSANPCTEEQYHTATFTTYQGRALAIVKAGKEGKVKVSISDNERSDISIIDIINENQKGGEFNA